MKAAGGGLHATGQHSGFDYTADSLTQSGSANSSESMEVCTTSDLGKRKRCSVRATRQHNGLNESGRHHETRIYDQHLLANAGDQRLVSLSMKTGKRLGFVDHIGPFLANLNQNGRVKLSWNASFQSKPYAVTVSNGSVPPKITCTGLNERQVIMQCFRHRMSKNNDDNLTGNLVQDEYPGSTTGKPHILFPNSTQAINEVYMPGAVPFSAQPPAGESIRAGFSKEEPGRVSFCAINRPDLEDMSWNLNKLKLQSPTFAPTDTSVSAMFQQNVPVFKENKHRRQSILQQNNFQSVDATDLGTAAPSADDKIAPYRYKACLRFGTVEYELMNKNDLGCHVEFIVYKFKKTANLSADNADYKEAIDSPSAPSNESAPAWYPLNKVFEAIGQGYLNTVGQDYATENLQGRRPKEIDIFTNPAYPLLPTLRKTVASMQPCVEVMRNKFAMSAGSRRTMKIHLPGELYNPCSIRNASIPKGEAGTGTDGQLVNDTSDNKMGDQLTPGNLPILDEYSYAVVIAVNGQKLTRFYESQVTNGTSCSDAILDFTSYTTNIVPPIGPNLMPRVFYLPLFPYYATEGTLPLGSGYLPDPQSSSFGVEGWPIRTADYPTWTFGNGGSIDTNYFYVPSGTPGQFAMFSCKVVNIPWTIVLGVVQWVRPIDAAGTTVNIPWPFYPMIEPGDPTNTKGKMITDIQLVSTACGFEVYDGTPVYPGIPPGCYTPCMSPVNTNPLPVYVYYLAGPPTPGVVVPRLPLMIRCDSITDYDPPDAAPQLYPMGDNYGAFHLDYCATYTEHVGACVYEAPNERNLYDCGQPQDPYINFGTNALGYTTAAKIPSEHGRVILPAVSAVRGTGGVSFTPGATNEYSQSTSSYTAGGNNNGNPAQ